ncbi:MAG: isochorismatase family protein [archaeon]
MKQNGNYGDCAVVVDMMEKFLAHLSNPGEIVENQRNVIGTCILNDVPVIAVEHGVSGHTVEPLQKLIRRARPRRNFIRKGDSDGFYGNRLGGVLRSLGVERVCLMGIYMNQCLLETAKDAKERGLGIIIAKDLFDNKGGNKHCLRDRERAMAWYGDNCSLFENHQEMIPSFFRAVRYLAA